MKKIFILSALAIAAIGCTKSEVVEAPESFEAPIMFETYSGRTPVTKAEVANVATLATDQFQVYAYAHKAGTSPSYTNPYMNKVVRGTEEDNSYKWTYDGKAYWPASYELDFVAYALNAFSESEEEEYSVTTDGNPTLTYKVPDDVYSQEDLLVATPMKDMVYNEGTSQQAVTANDGKVSLQFSHMLSRIGFSLVTTNNTDIPVTIEHVSLEGMFFTEGVVDLVNVHSESQLPYISTKDKNASSKVYTLLGDTDNDPATAPKTYTHYGTNEGSPIHDNSSLYTKLGTTTENDFNDDEYVPVVTISNTEYTLYQYTQEEGTTKYAVKKDNENHSVTKGADGTYTLGDKIEGEVNLTVADTYTEVDQANLDNRYMMVIPVSTWSDYTYNYTDETGAEKSDGKENCAILRVKYFLPNAGTFDEIILPLKSTVSTGTDGNTATEQAITFEPGKAYEFMFKVSTAGIGFEVAVTDWNTSNQPEGNNTNPITTVIYNLK